MLSCINLIGSCRGKHKLWVASCWLDLLCASWQTNKPESVCLKQALAWFNGAIYIAHSVSTPVCEGGGSWCTAYTALTPVGAHVACVLCAVCVCVCVCVCARVCVCVCVLIYWCEMCTDNTHAYMYGIAYSCSDTMVRRSACIYKDSALCSLEPMHIYYA